MEKKYLNKLIIGISLCVLGCGNLLLENYNIITFIQIVFGIPFVVIGIWNIKNKTN